MLKNSKNLKLALVSVAVVLGGLAAAGPAAAATTPTAPAVVRAQEAAVPVDFVDGPTTPLIADGARHKVTVTYTNDTSADRTVAPQLLVQSPDAGPFLTPSDLRVEARTADGCWQTVPLGTQTGTLFTDLPTAQHTLHPGETLTQTYRVTVLNPEARGRVSPRVALYG
ncbi:signal peptide protein [Streptomyces sp. NPDC047072]|uniref:signal peptide protein n=1 Tax=Streptomyces sp. NPDC047072 TaxID=3154809 RepID=UPI003404B68E